MDAAALVLLVSGVGVGFGWQPMPDGSPRYEYIVQVEPELLATLADGQSIPISGEVPEHVHPIARVRLVVGREAPPRQQLVTLLKPVADGPAADAGEISQAQYSEPMASRYGQPAQYPGNTAAANSGASEWNPPPAGQPAPVASASPSGQDLFTTPTAGQGTSWNDGTAIPALAAAPREAIQQFGDTIQDAAQNAAAPLRDGVDRINSGVKSAADRLGGRTQQVVDELLRTSDGGLGATASPDYRQPATTTTAADSRNSAWNGGESANMGQAPPASQPAATPPFSTSAPAARPPLASQPGASDTGRTWNDQPQATQPPTTPPLAAPADDERWATSADPRLRGQTASPVTPPTSEQNRPNVADGRTWPTDDPARGSIPTGTTPNFWTGDIGTAPPALGAAGAPEVASAMLNRDAKRDLEGVDPAAQFTGAPGAPATTGADPAKIAATPKPSDALNVAAEGWLDGAGKKEATAAKESPSRGDNAMVVLAAWVLLSGSVAGNLYLFWSYLDVRQKYRALVRKTARAVGSRFSAA
jgi:hypothetical protein